ncbi:MAG: response regulator [Flavobacteriaceae bacterium]|nr:response regulator [Flavobacteriaceae bacterium]
MQLRFLILSFFIFCQIGFGQSTIDLDTSLSKAKAFSNKVENKDSVIYYLEHSLKQLSSLKKGDKKSTYSLEIADLYLGQNQLKTADSLLHTILIQTNNAKDKMKAYHLLHNIHFNDLVGTKERFKYLDLAEKLIPDLTDKNLIAEYYFLYGNIYMYDDEVVLALNYLRKARENIEKTNKELRIRVNTSLHIVYSFLGATEKSLEFSLESIALAKETNNIDEEINGLFGVIESYLNLGEYEKLNSIFDRLLILNEQANDNTDTGYLYLLQGQSQLDQNNLTEAFDYFQKALDFAKKTNDKTIFIGAHVELTDLYFQKQNIDKALFHGLEAKQTMDHFDSEFNITLAQVLAKSGKHKKAFELYEENIAYEKEQDSLINHFNIVSSLLNQNFDFEKQQEQEHFKNEFDFQSKINNRNQIIVVFTSIISFLIFLFFYNKRRNRTMQDKLTKQVNEQTTKIIKQKERLQELDTFKSRLYTNITHEFRTPLTVILGMSEQLESGLAQMPPEKAREKLSFIQRNGHSLLSLINQMLDLSKVDNNQLKINYIQGDILSYVRYISESFHSHANTQNVIIKVESKKAEILMDYDPEKFRQILSNLLSNAIKYTSSGDRITISINTEQTGNETNNFMLSVSDTGAGIEAAHLPHIFDRFYQANDSIAKSGGTGIGLALTKELVHLLGGTISADSTINKGSILIVKLPIHNNVKLTAAKNELDIENDDVIDNSLQITPVKNDATKENVTLPKLLIIEDNLDVVEYLTSCLETHYNLEFAYNGKAGIEKALEVSPEIIVSDVMMPEKDGFEVCETLKNDERSSHIPIILLTAKADIDSRIAGLSRGADAYLQKPFHQKELLVTLENLLKIRQKLQKKYQDTATKFPYKAVETTSNPEDIFIQKLRAVIEKRLGDSGLKAEDICKDIGMGRSNLYAKLQAITGMSFNIYLRTLRLNKAKILLLDDSLNVSEIAYEVGYNDPKYFSRIFSEEFGVTPSKFNL